MPTHSITFRGYVQYVGLREIVMDLGKTQDRRGFVIKETDGTLRLVTSGSHEEVAAFVDDIRYRSDVIPAEIESVDVETVDGEALLPPFDPSRSDYLTMFNRQLDQALEHLSNIEANLSSPHANEEDLDRLSASEENLDSHHR